MNNDETNILFIADIVGKPGLKAVEALYPVLKEKYTVGFTVANGENAAAGKGIRPKDADFLFDLGIDVITSGNHIWSKDKIFDYFDSHPRLLRPANYPESCPGSGVYTGTASGGTQIGVINVQGRSFLYPLECPFRTTAALISRLRAEKTRVILVDFHAEATAEKMALGWYIDGTAAAVIGTHTHVQTADEQILAKGTAYITDAGMTGPVDSVIGMDKETAINRFVTLMPQHYKTADGEACLNGVVISVDTLSGKATGIKRINIPAGC